MDRSDVRFGTLNPKRHVMAPSVAQRRTAPFHAGGQWKCDPV